MNSFKNLCFWALLSAMSFSYASCSHSDSLDSDFTGIWKEDYSELYTNGVKTKTIKDPYTQYLTGGLGYGPIEIDEDGFPYRVRARLYHQFHSGSILTTYGYINKDESIIEAKSDYSYKYGENVLVINDIQFEILDKKADRFTVKEELGKSLVGIFRESDAYLNDFNCDDDDSYVITHYKKVSKLGE